MGEVAIKRTRRYVTATYIPSIVECRTCKTQHAENTACPRCLEKLTQKAIGQTIDSATLPSYDSPVFVPATLAGNTTLQDLAEEK